MNSKLSVFLVALFFLAIMFIYFLINPSYEKSLRAKYYYEVGNYTEALALAKESFALDKYNRMAITVMAQSITSMKYVTYLEDAKKYMKIINEIATHESVSDTDKAKMRLICEIMLSSYVKLAPSVVTDSTLIRDARKYHNEFGELLEKITR